MRRGAAAGVWGAEHMRRHTIGTQSISWAVPVPLRTKGRAQGGTRGGVLSSRILLIAVHMCKRLHMID